jgi:hypothetical protein
VCRGTRRRPAVWQRCHNDIDIHKARRATAEAGSAAIDFGTEAEGKVQLHIGEPFQVAGQVWQISEIRNPTDPIG